MRIFKKPNVEFGWKCPVCGTDEIKEVVLINVYGTSDGKICEGEQFHLNCIDLWYYKSNGLLVMKVES